MQYVRQISQAFSCHERSWSFVIRRIKEVTHCHWKKKIVFYTHVEEITSLRYYCQDHSVPCCTMCICTRHRKYNSIEPVEETAKRLRTKEHYTLFVAMGELEKELTDIKSELENNIVDIEETSDNLSKSAKALYTKIQKYIEGIKKWVSQKAFRKIQRIQKKTSRKFRIPWRQTCLSETM